VSDTARLVGASREAAGVRAEANAPLTPRRGHGLGDAPRPRPIDAITLQKAASTT
jgi:hypothetical protein